MIFGGGGPASMTTTTGGGGFWHIFQPTAAPMMPRMATAARAYFAPPPDGIPAGCREGEGAFETIDGFT
jgi:hypothetical protein